MARGAGRARRRSRSSAPTALAGPMVPGEVVARARWQHRPAPEGRRCVRILPAGARCGPSPTDLRGISRVPYVSHAGPSILEQRRDQGFRGAIGVGAEGVEPSRPEAAGFKPAVSTVPPRARGSRVLQRADKPGPRYRGAVYAVVAAAVGAAALYAVASVLQHRAAVEQPAERSLRLGLLAGLIRRPSWVLGILADGAAFALQFAALAAGAIVVVQLLLVLGLLFALPLGALVSGRRPRLVDTVAAAVVCAGLAVFLAAAAPAPGLTSVPASTWSVLLAVGLGVASALVAMGHRARGPARPALLGGAAGVFYGISAGLTKATGELLADQGVQAFTHWQPYALVVVGAAGVVVGQSAFQAGDLGLSLPTMSAADPVVSVLVGALAFRETLAGSPAALAAEVGGMVAVVAGVYLLARSPTIRASRAQPVVDQPGRAP